MNKVKKVLFSAIQPSGMLTIGNYIGVLNNLSYLQQEYDCLFCVADLHALTVRQNPVIFKNYIFDVIALYLACGVDPKKSIIFIQSDIFEHTQLYWILNCFSYVGELSRMTQFKEKSSKYSKNINSGLLTYPILMASDVLLYNTNLILVGEDQKQHLEFIKNLVIRFNSLYGMVFELPKSLILTPGIKIMALLDPSKKMSKSDSNVNNTIYLLENIDSVMKKIKQAKTDSDNPPSIVYDTNNKLGISNLLNIFSHMSGQSIADLEILYSNKLYSNFKHDVAISVSEKLLLIQRNYDYIRKNEDYLQSIMYSGAKKAKLRAGKILSKVYSSIGLPVKCFI
ncbi:MAG: tryptophan--tRNA ligase [Buchnera aphidicola (Eriosoma harunire)]